MSAGKFDPTHVITHSESNFFPLAYHFFVPYIIPFLTFLVIIQHLRIYLPSHRQIYLLITHVPNLRTSQVLMT